MIAQSQRRTVSDYFPARVLMLGKKRRPYRLYCTSNDTKPALLCQHQYTSTIGRTRVGYVHDIGAPAAVSYGNRPLERAVTFGRA